MKNVKKPYEWYKMLEVKGASDLMKKYVKLQT